MGLVGKLWINPRKSAIGVWLRSCFFLWLCGSAPAAFAQAVPTGSNYESGVAVTVGATNTQFPFYADNAAGGSISIYFQRSTFVGVQAMASAYPYSARFTQAPLTVGWRVGTLPTGGESSLWTGWNPFIYAGGGFAYSQNSSFDRQPLPGTAAPCLQASLGLDHGHRHWMWRVMEVSWTRTYNSTSQLRTLGVSTGLVYNFPQ
jgi:hypothetical protein